MVVRHYRRQKKEAAKGATSQKKKKKKGEVLKPEVAEAAGQMSPFAFFNAWVNGKDRARQFANEESARDRSGDEDLDATFEYGEELEGADIAGTALLNTAEDGMGRVASSSSLFCFEDLRSSSESILDDESEEEREDGETEGASENEDVMTRGRREIGDEEEEHTIWSEKSETVIVNGEEGPNSRVARLRHMLGDLKLSNHNNETQENHDSVTARVSSEASGRERSYTAESEESRGMECTPTVELSKCGQAQKAEAAEATVKCEEVVARLGLMLEVEFPHFSFNMEYQRVDAIVSVRAPAAPSGGSAAERAPVAIVAAIDRSSSMKGTSPLVTRTDCA